MLYLCCLASEILKFFFLDFHSEVRSKMESLGGGKWQCLDCLYVSQSCNVKKHIESKHLIPQDYQCRFCDKLLRGKHAYNNHLYSAHKDLTQKLNMKLKMEEFWTCFLSMFLCFLSLVEMLNVKCCYRCGIWNSYLDWLLVVEITKGLSKILAIKNSKGHIKKCILGRWL